MSQLTLERERIDTAAGTSLSIDAMAELDAMGLGPSHGLESANRAGIDPVAERRLYPKRAITSLEVLNEAYDYALPSSFSRGMRVELGEAAILYLSGTASIDEDGRTLYSGDFEAQCLRTFRNLTSLLASESASWHDVVRTTCYLRDIERDYDTFNRVRTLFMTALGLDPVPASTGIQARLCRSDLLVEIEAIAIVPRDAGD
ncbi:MAG: Rid family hydrolase [Thermoanaerobaculia bacterium]